MFAYLIPLYLGLGAIGLLVVSSAIGLLFQWSPRLAPVGHTILWYSCLSFGTAVLFAFAATWPLMFVLSVVLGDTGGVIALWAAAPIGLLVGFGLAARYPSGQRLFAKASYRCAVAGTTLIFLAGGLWLLQASQPEPRPTTPTLGRGGP